MKNNQAQNQQSKPQAHTSKRPPENKDDIDSRGNEEQLVNGDKTTNNKTEKQSDHKKHKH